MIMNNVKQIKNYLIIIGSTFCGIFFLISMLFLMVYLKVPGFNATDNLKSIAGWLVFTSAFSFGITGIINGIILFIKIIGKAHIAIKILSAILFFITLYVIIVGGIVSLLPYYIYSIVQYRKLNYNSQLKNEA